MHALYLLSVYLHIIAATVWIGGMVFVAAVLVPFVRKPEMRAQTASLLYETGIKFRMLGWVTLATFIVTGSFALYRRGVRWSSLVDGAFWASPFGHLVGTKLLIVATVLALSGVHDFYIGPRATEVMAKEPGSPAAMRLRKTASWMGRINLLLALGAAAVGVMLVRGSPF